jgi:hypothetical protein
MSDRFENCRVAAYLNNAFDRTAQQRRCRGTLVVSLLGARSMQTLGGTKRMIDIEDSNANGARAGATALVILLCVGISCDSVRCMRSNTVQQRSVVVVREDRAD